MTENIHTIALPEPQQFNTAQPQALEVLQKRHKSAKKNKSPKIKKNGGNGKRRKKETTLKIQGMRKYDQIDKSKLLNMYFVNNNQEADIARYFNVTRQAINKLLAPFKAILSGQDTLEAYRQHYPNILSSVELKLMNELVDEKRMAKATTGNVAYALDKITMHRRLQAGEATARVAYEDIQSEEKEIAMEIESLQRRLGLYMPDEEKDTQDTVIEGQDMANNQYKSGGETG